MTAGKIPFSLIVKPAGSRCNLHCRYCYYLEKSKYSSHERQTVMGDDLLEAMIVQAIQGNPGPVVSFTWHGGEPTLAGLDFYRKAVAFEKKHLPRGWQAWNNLQTNGLLLDNEWCRFLQKEHFDVGLSIDGTETVHDTNRVDLGGNGTWKRVRESCRRLQRTGVQPDLLCTVTSASAADPVGVYRSLRELDTGWIQFIPVVVYREDGTLTEESVTPEAYGDFLTAVFDEWMTNDLGRLDVQLFAECAKVWAGGSAAVCTMAPTCGQVLVVEEDGAVYACDHYVDSEHRLGSLERDRLDDLAHGSFQRAFGLSKQDSLTETCKHCPYLSVCSGGCPKDRTVKGPAGEKGHYLLCPGLLRFFAHAEPRLREMMRLSGEGRTPAEIMERMRINGNNMPG